MFKRLNIYIRANNYNHLTKAAIHISEKSNNTFPKKA